MGMKSEGKIIKEGKSKGKRDREWKNKSKKDRLGEVEANSLGRYKEQRSGKKKAKI